MRMGVAWIQFEGAPVFNLGVGPAPLFLQHVCQENMRFSKVRIEFQRFSGCADCFRARLSRRRAEKNRAKSSICVCQAYIGGSKGRVSLYPLLQMTDTFLDARSPLSFNEDETAFVIV